MPDVSVLNIALGARPIGTLTSLPGDRSILSFRPDYIEDSRRPILSLSYKDRLGGLRSDFGPVQTRIDPFFSNLLPEGPLRRYLAERADVKPVREFFLLWALGRDLPGAVTVRPADGQDWPLERPDEAAKARGDRRNALRFSLAGVQLKFSALKGEGGRGGLTIPARGVGGHWIVKLPFDRFEGVPENEFAMLSIARAIGIEVPDAELVDIAAIEGLPEDIGAMKGKALSVRRFDRGAGPAIHIEDFAQVFGVYPEAKYEKASYRSIASVLGIETDERSIAEFVRRLVFGTLIGNADMHLKNWSLIYPDGRSPRLSPAYDLLSTIPYIPTQDAALNYARTRKMNELTYDELAYLAAKARLPERSVLRTARETVEAFQALWPSQKNHLGLAKAVVTSIDQHLGSLALLKQ